jgi:DNA repair protein RadC
MGLAGDDAGRLDGLDFAKLCRLKGMGLAKSSAVLSAIELSRRMQKQEGVLRPFWVYTGTGGH